ncbi:MAG: hypothetical protein MI747_25510 [Desulfobacterales bacterium]|nr:hypothetical protein [Desulfobacterales bacterium]
MRFITVLWCLGLLVWADGAQALLRPRVVILPFYVEHGGAAREDVRARQYRRMGGRIENRLASNGFEVVDPFAGDALEMELNRIMERAREDSMLAARNICSRYAVDAAYLIWLDVRTRKTRDGYWKATAVLDGKGYDSAGRSLGAHVFKSFKVTRRDLDLAVALAEQEVGDWVGDALIRWARGDAGNGKRPAIVEPSRFLRVRLDQANAYEWVEVFGKVLNTVRGVVDVKQYSQRIVHDNPQACVSEWTIEIDPAETDPFRLQANLMKMVKDVLDAGGQTRIKGVAHRYSLDEVKMLAGFVPLEATAHSLQFVVDRQRARDRMGGVK